MHPTDGLMIPVAPNAQLKAWKEIKKELSVMEVSGWLIEANGAYYSLLFFLQILF